jgi:GNAT superfamily N-acetyltransferase
VQNTAPDPEHVAAIRDALAGADPGTQAYLEVGARLDSVSAVHAEPGAVAWLSRHAAWNRPWIIAMAEDPLAGAACVQALVERTGPPEGLTVERRTYPHLPTDLRPVEHWEWDWWFTRQPPPRRPGEDDVIALGTADPRVPALLEVANPDAMARPGDPRITGWWGIPVGTGPDPSANGPLVAVAAVTTMRPGIPHLGSVATHPQWRGRGLSRDLCARLTRDALSQGAPAVTLGMHAANRSARAVYSSLGYQVGYRWASGRLIRSP